jgi:hypothetical protein
MAFKKTRLPYAEKILKFGREHVLAQKRESYQRNKEHHKAKVYEYRAKNKEHWLKVTREYHKKRVASDPDYWRRKAIKGQYGITFEQYRAMVETQGNKCAICEGELSQADTRLKPHIDHCHATNTVRGVLCNLCNVMLGSARDDIQILKRAMRYLCKASQQIKGA